MKKKSVFILEEERREEQHFNTYDSLPEKEQLFFDLSDMRALAPSWCDEFFGEAAVHYPNRIVIDETIPMGLKKSFEVISDARKIDFSFGKFQE